MRRSPPTCRTPRRPRPRSRASRREVGPIDVLLNSAGAAKRFAPEELGAAAFRQGMDAKYFSTMHVLEPVVRAMAARGRGAVVNVIGQGGRVASPMHIPGGAANSALMLATVGLRAGLRRAGCASTASIRASPGPTGSRRAWPSRRARAGAAATRCSPTSSRASRWAAWPSRKRSPRSRCSSRRRGELRVGRDRADGRLRRLGDLRPWRAVASVGSGPPRSSIVRTCCASPRRRRICAIVPGRSRSRTFSRPGGSTDPSVLSVHTNSTSSRLERDRHDARRSRSASRQVSRSRRVHLDLPGHAHRPLLRVRPAPRRAARVRREDQDAHGRTKVARPRCNLSTPAASVSGRCERPPLDHDAVRVPSRRGRHAACPRRRRPRPPTARWSRAPAPARRSPSKCSWSSTSGARPPRSAGSSTIRRSPRN
jgi:hypothetical protein